MIAHTLRKIDHQNNILVYRFDLSLCKPMVLYSSIGRAAGVFKLLQYKGDVILGFTETVFIIITINPHSMLFLINTYLSRSKMFFILCCVFLLD